MNISGVLAFVFLIALVSSIMIQSPEVRAQEDNSSLEVEFLEINIEPKNILVGDSIEIYATIINNSDSPITFQAGCDSPIWIEFLSDNIESIASPSCQSEGTAEIEPGQTAIVKAPRQGLLYKAISAGDIEALVNFGYGIGEQTVPSKKISKMIALQINSEKESPSKNIEEIRKLSPHKQVSSGINPQDVICSKEMQLIFKSTDNSPACVKPSTAEKLIQRGWAKS